MGLDTAIIKAASAVQYRHSQVSQLSQLSQSSQAHSQPGTIINA